MTDDPHVAARNYVVTLWRITTFARKTEQGWILALSRGHRETHLAQRQIDDVVVQAKAWERDHNDDLDLIATHLKKATTHLDHVRMVDTLTSQIAAKVISDQTTQET